MRDLHPDFKNLICSGDIAPVRLVELHMEPEPYYYWDGIGNLQYGGKIFKGVGHLGEIDPIKETGDPKAAQVNVTINCLDKVEDFSDLRNQLYQGRTAMIHYGLLSPAENALIAVEEGAFVGRMDSMSVKTSPSGSRITLRLVNEMTFLKKAWGKFQTDADHRADYPSDTSRRFIPAIQDLKIRL